MCHRRHPQTKPLPDPVTADESFYSIETTASATECTGLMPAVPYTEDGRENLSELMAIHSPPEAPKAEDPARSPLTHGNARPDGARN